MPDDRLFSQLYSSITPITNCCHPEFMATCSENNVEVLYIDGMRMRRAFMKEYSSLCRSILKDVMIYAGKDY